MRVDRDWRGVVIVLAFLGLLAVEAVSKVGGC